LTPNRHVGGISAEAQDVFVNPVQCRLLVQQSIISRRWIARLRIEGRKREKAKYIQTVIDRHYDDAIYRHHFAGVVVISRIPMVESAMDEDKHWEQLPGS